MLEVIIKGPGGCGKTFLAEHIKEFLEREGWRVAVDFPKKHRKKFKKAAALLKLRQVCTVKTVSVETKEPNSDDEIPF